MALKYASTTTLNRIRNAHPCQDGWTKLLAHLGKTKADDEPLDLLTVLDSNGLEDALWVLSYAMPDDRLARHFQAWCAEQVLHIYEAAYPGDMRVRDQIAMLRNDSATDAERDAARRAADADDADDAARAALAADATEAADAAADAAAWVAWAADATEAAWAAADAAAWAASAAQERQLRKMLTEVMADEDSRANVTGCRIVTVTLIAAALTFLLIASPTIASMWQTAREVIHDALDGSGTLTACEGLEPAECVALAQEGR